MIPCGEPGGRSIDWALSPRSHLGPDRRIMAEIQAASMVGGTIAEERFILRISGVSSTTTPRTTRRFKPLRRRSGSLQRLRSYRGAPESSNSRKPNQRLAHPPTPRSESQTPPTTSHSEGPFGKRSRTVGHPKGKIASLGLQPYFLKSVVIDGLRRFNLGGANVSNRI
jgi:hypothetical protein